MISRILEYVKQHQMIEPGDRLVAGVSGGADSVCLFLVLDALREALSFEMTVVHVEHGLRGEASLQDAAFVQALCRKHGYSLRVFHVDAAKTASQEGMSLEEAGRKLRYACFSQVCRETGANKIAVAHHQDDQAETVLLHLFRGAGLLGLCGMQPVRGNVIRPLLEVSRADIEKWLTEQGISWRTDSTNLEENYARNKLRLHVMPYVEKEIQGKAAAHIAAAAGRLQQIRLYLEQKTEEAYAACAGKEGRAKIRIDLEVFWQQEELLRVMVLQKALEQMERGLKDISALHVEALLKLAAGESGKRLCLPYGICARREYRYLLLEEAWQELASDLKVHGKTGQLQGEGEKGASVEIAVPGDYKIKGMIWRFSVEDAKKYQGIPEKTYTKWFDYDTIKKCLTVRTRRPGDFLEINREHGRKKLKDYLIDQKVPRRERDGLCLLTDGSHVLWVLGMRISEACKVTKDTKRLLRVEVFGGDTDDREDQCDDPGRKGECQDQRAGSSD